MQPVARSVLALILASAAACADASQQPAEEPLVLGPADGQDLTGTDLERVAVGDLAPDFTLAALAGPPVTLSDFRGRRNVVLVFYRGHW